MINIFCDKCTHNSNAKLQVRTEGDTIVIECLECGEMQRLKENQNDIKIR